MDSTPYAKLIPDDWLPVAPSGLRISDGLFLRVHSVILNRGIAIARVPYPRTKYTRSLRGRRFYARSLSRSHTDSPPASDDHPFTINEFVCPGLMIAENEFE